MRRLGWSLIPALLLAACSTPATPAPTRLELAAGTYQAQGQTTIGTALLLRVLENSASPKADVQVSIRGPEGWNGNQPLTVTFRAGEPLYWQVRSDVAARAGVYTASATVGGQALSRASGAVSLSSTLPVPGNVRVTGNSNQTFTLA